MTQSRRPLTLAAALLVSGTLGACTPSVSASYDGTDPFAHPVLPGVLAEQPQSKGPGLLGAPVPERGSGHVIVALAPGAELSQEALASFKAATGVSAQTVELASDEDTHTLEADVVVGLDILGVDAARSTVTDTPPFELSYPSGVGEAIAGALPYGRDDVCVLADSGWMSAGKRSIPEGIGAVSGANVGFLLSVPDPASTHSGAFFLLGAALSVGDSLGEWARSLNTSGAFIGSDDEAKNAWRVTAEITDPHALDSAPYPLLVAPMSTIMDTRSVPGVEARAHPLPATCVERYLYAAELRQATNPSGAASFLAWLEGSSGQQALADAGSVYPLDPSHVENTPAHWFLTPSSDAVTLSAQQIAELAQLRATWAEARAR